MRGFYFSEKKKSEKMLVRSESDFCIFRIIYSCPEFLQHKNYILFSMQWVPVREFSALGKENIDGTHCFQEGALTFENVSSFTAVLPLCSFL